MKHRSFVLVLSAVVILGAGTLVWTQEQTPVIASSTQPAPTQLLSPQQLDNLVAPVALYPDPLLGQILVASTYPLEIVEANQWLQRNKGLRGQQLMDAAKQQPWDPSVQALVAVPDALTVLNQDIQWTTDLGNAFLAQQSDVMNAVQRMRTQARNNGKLNSTPQMTVTTEDQDGSQAVVIEPANPEVIYVPYYDPYYIWGPPAFGFYPPLFYSGFGFGFWPGINIGFCFDGWGGWGGWGAWGWGPNWFGRTVIVNNSFFPRFGFHNGFRGGFGGRMVWTHDPVHRLDVPYASRSVANRFHGSWLGQRNSAQAGTRAGAAVVPFANRTVGRPVYQSPRNTTSQFQRFQDQPQARYRAPQQRYQAPQQRYQTPGYQAPQQRYQAPQQRYQTPRYQAPQQRYQAPQQRYQAPRYQAPQQRYQAPRYQAPQQYRSAPQMSAPRFSGGGGFRGGAVARGGGSRGGGGGRRR